MNRRPVYIGATEKEDLGAYETVPYLLNIYVAKEFI